MPGVAETHWCRLPEYRYSSIYTRIATRNKLHKVNTTSNQFSCKLYFLLLPLQLKYPFPFLQSNVNKTEVTKINTLWLHSGWFAGWVGEWLWISHGVVVDAIEEIYLLEDHCSSLTMQRQVTQVIVRDI